MLNRIRIVIRHSRPFPFSATSRFDALRLLKALSLSMGASPERLAGFVILPASQFPGATFNHAHTVARESLASTMERVCADHTPVIITRNRNHAVVMLSLEDYESLEETASLVRSPANAKRLLEAIHALESRKGIARDIDIDIDIDA